MGKPRRTAASFATAVQMSSVKLFVIVEGRKVDRPFYDRILRNLGGLDEADFEICLAEDIELSGKAAAGKRHALALFSEWQRKQVLVQSNSIGTRIIAVAVDRDLDVSLEA